MHTFGVQHAAWDSMNSMTVKQGPVSSCGFKFRDFVLSAGKGAPVTAHTPAPATAVQAAPANLAASLTAGNYATVAASHSLPSSRADGSFTAEAWVRPDEKGSGTILSKY